MNLIELSGRDKKHLVQLALDLPKVKQEKLQWPMLWSEKLDGVYCLALKHNNEMAIFSRTGEQYTSMRHVEQELYKALAEDDIVIFEAYEPGVEQSVISGHCRDTKNQHPELLAYCHTYLTLDEFINGGHTDFVDSYVILKCTIPDYPGVHLRLVQQKPVHSLEEAMELTKQVWDRGGEGGVLRSYTSLYAGGSQQKILSVGDRRNQDIIKLKQVLSYDLEVVSLKEGKGKYTGMTGVLVCRWKDGKTVEASGMTDEQRKLWWEHPEEIIGKIVEVHAMKISSKGLLREPRYRSTRFDKCEGDF